MDTETRRESARIYRFPPGGRTGGKPEAKPAIAVATIPTGRGWYHDVAIRDAKSGTDPEPRV